MHVDIYTDGAARGNPNGPGGYGVVLEYVDSAGRLHTREYSQGYIQTTNNRMELMAVIKGLSMLTKKCDVNVYSDSQYVVNAYNKDWISTWRKKGFKDGNVMRLNYDLWMKLDELAAKHNVSFIWVKGHAGHMQNELCDRLATTAADGDNLIEDIGFTERK